MHHIVSSNSPSNYSIGNFHLDAAITGHSIMSGAGFIIALGVFIIILSALGKYKHQEENPDDFFCY